jgi:hypothetical protein
MKRLLVVPWSSALPVVIATILKRCGVQSQPSISINGRRPSPLENEEFDILVIGGGVTGAGIALDAATRGLKIALVESQDYAAGTSSRSSKLIHGGLRYLEQYDFKLVREALHERELMVTTQAPHLVKPLSFLYPLHNKVRERTYVGAGIFLYDILRGLQRALPNHKHLSHKRVQAAAPCLNPKIITKGNWDLLITVGNCTTMMTCCNSFYRASSPDHELGASPST